VDWDGERVLVGHRFLVEAAFNRGHQECTRSGPTGG
jgi:hypothetical protein